MSDGQATVQDEAKPVSGNSRRPRRGSYKPMPETLALLKVSGNPINGLGTDPTTMPYRTALPSSMVNCGDCTLHPSTTLPTRSRLKSHHRRCKAVAPPIVASELSVAVGTDRDPQQIRRFDGTKLLPSAYGASRVSIPLTWIGE